MCQATERVKRAGEVVPWSDKSLQKIPNAETYTAQSQDQEYQYGSNRKLKLSITILIGRGKRTLWKIWWWCVRSHF